MSATGRDPGSREPNDNYPTPAWAVRRFLEKCSLPGGLWLEPGAGNGAVILAVNSARSDVTWTAIEKYASVVPKPPFGNYERDGNLWVIADFLDPATSEIASTYKFIHDVAIGNPPYKLAQAFAEECFKRAKITALLLRLNFLGSEERHEWWTKHPADIYILPNRPSFIWKLKCSQCGWHNLVPVGYTGDRACSECDAKCKLTTSDATEYAWFVWGQCSEHGRVFHLATTPEVERNGMGRIIDQREGETEAQARARHEEEQLAGLAGFEIGKSYVLDDGRLAKFEGTSRQFGFFGCTKADSPVKVRLEGVDAPEPYVSSLDPIECPSCHWLIAGEAAESAECCPFCGAA